MTETVMIIIILISATGHMALADTGNYLPLLPILYFLKRRKGNL